MATRSLKHWRECSTLIILAKKAPTTTPCSGILQNGANFDMFVQKRKSNASMFADNIVYPGGVAEPGDSDPKWIDLFKSFGFGISDFESLFHRDKGIVTPILEDNPVLRQISLRITAIREVFEEVGILLCKHKNENPGNIWASSIPDVDIDHWQNKVHENPEEFLNLCNHLKCYPNIWALHYWNNWLTPVNEKMFKKRFDTAFFVTAFQKRPEFYIEKNEVAVAEWKTPKNLLDSYNTGKVFLPPPQLYETTKLSGQTDIGQLIEFAHKHSPFGGPLIFPIQVGVKNGALSLLPGDDLYPKTPDLIGGIHHDQEHLASKTMEELRTKVMHRFETKDYKHYNLICNNYKYENHLPIEGCEMKFQEN